MFRFRASVGFLVCLLLLLAVSAVGAQATPVPLTTTALMEGGQDLVNTFGLFALVSVAAFIGIAAMLVRRMRRAAM